MPSENLSAVVLIAIALAGGLVLYAAMPSLITAGSASLVMVESAEARVDPSCAIITVSIKNLAQKQMRLVGLLIQVEGMDIADFNVDVPPGKNVMLVLPNPPGIWVAGEKKNIVVTATFSDGSQSSITAPLMVFGTSWYGVERDPITGPPSSPPNNPPSSDPPPPSPSPDPPPGSGGGSRIIIFADDFRDGLSGWRAWGNASGIVVEVARHGRPSPCLHIYGAGGDGSLAGASKTVNVALQTPATLHLTFDYNVQALRHQGAFPGNLWVMVLGPGDSVVFREKVYEARSADSGWRTVSVTIPPITGEVTIVIYTQVLGENHDVWIDNVVLEA